MYKIFIVGDSHASRLAFGWGKTDRKIQMKLKENSGVSAFNVNYNYFSQLDLKDYIILVNFGEVDIRKYLPKYNNAEEVVDQYVKNTLEAFKNNKVVFIEPTPQAEDKDYGKFKYNKNDGFNLIDRLSQQFKFNNRLNTHDIDIIKIKDVIGVEILNSEYTDDGCHLNDKYSIILADYVYDYLNKSLSSPPTH